MSSVWLARVLATLWPVAPLLAIPPAVLTIATYLLGGADTARRYEAIIVGLIGGLAGLAVGAVVLRDRTASSRALPGVYLELRDRVEQMQARIVVETKATLGATTKSRTAALTEAAANIGEVKTLLAEQRGPGWATGTSYVAAWRLVLSAERALIEAESAPALLADALHTRLLLGDSRVGDGELLDVLDRAVATISGLEASPTTSDAEVESRTTVREIRHALDDFRLSGLEGLVRARNRLIASSMVASIAGYLLAAGAVLGGIGFKDMAVGVSYYLVGATVGLFDLLRAIDTNSRTVKDFRLVNLVLVSRPFMSGLSGLALAILLAETPALLPTAVTVSGALPEAGPLGFLAAAIGGLAPSIVASLTGWDVRPLFSRFEGMWPFA